MKFELNALMLGLITAATLSISGCGGGGGGGGGDKPPTAPVTGGETPAPTNPSTGNESPGVANPGVDSPDPITVNGQPITVEAMNLARKSGVWASRFEYYEPLPAGSTAPGVVIAHGSGVTSWQYISDEEIIVDECEAEGPVTETLAEFNTFTTEEEEVDPEEEAEEVDPDDICSAGIEPEFFAVSDTHYRANLLCQGQRVGAMEISQISTQPGFNQGTLSFSTDSQGNFNASNGVCGGIFAGLGSEGHVGSIEIIAPYGDDARVELSVLTYSGLRTGVHKIGGGLVDGTFFDINTSRFDDEAPPVGPQAYPSEGTLTIDSLDKDSVSGSFEMTTEDGEKVQGNFDLNMR